MCLTAQTNLGFINRKAVLPEHCQTMSKSGLHVSASGVSCSSPGVWSKLHGWWDLGWICEEKFTHLCLVSSRISAGSHQLKPVLVTRAKHYRTCTCLLVCGPRHQQTWVLQEVGSHILELGLWKTAAARTTTVLLFCLNTWFPFFSPQHPFLIKYLKSLPFPSLHSIILHWSLILSSES